MKKGFTLVEIMIVVAIIGLLAAIAIPSFMRARSSSQANACINNLRQIDSGKEQLGMEMGLTNMTVIDIASLVGPDRFIKQWPMCPLTNVRSTAIADIMRGASQSYARVAADFKLGSNAVCYIGSNLTPVAHALPAQ